jgi:hypothetical protein
MHLYTAASTRQHSTALSAQKEPQTNARTQRFPSSTVPLDLICAEHVNRGEPRLNASTCAVENTSPIGLCSRMQHSSTDRELPTDYASAQRKQSVAETQHELERMGGKYSTRSLANIEATRMQAQRGAMHAATSGSGLPSAPPPTLLRSTVLKVQVPLHMCCRATGPPSLSQNHHRSVPKPRPAPAEP